MAAGIIWMVHIFNLCNLSGIYGSSFSFKSYRLESASNRYRRDSHVNYKLAWIKPCSITFSSNGTKPAGISFELAGTQSVQDSTLFKTSKLIQLMIRFMAHDTLERVSEVSFGIFSSNELLTDAFPDHAVSDECKFSCNDECSSLCYNGLPRANSSAYPGLRVVVVDANIECREDDPENKMVNLLVKSFAESIFTHLFPPQIISILEDNMNKTKDVWNVQPQTVLTYWVEAVLTWFNARSSKGAMNVCSSSGHLCSSEFDNRKNMKTKDLFLFTTLSALFNYEREYLLGKISTCEW
ncbi:uncharacterized protein LOC127736978 [Mytilus californianus]|uniref:uncharacterized protein LOC127736978 n=1 Tax=Mytilus californianus TaxID=6549 RepID=UPI0022473242|nr:uncharacterized protein LOC127736978 [Mytilus californianus]